MIDMLVIGWSSRCKRPQDQSVETMIKTLMSGQNLKGDRVSRGYRWVRSQRCQNAVELRPTGRIKEHLKALVRFQQYADPETGASTITGELIINPTRLLAQIGDASIERWFRGARAIVPEPPFDPHNNFLPEEMLLPSRPDFEWCDAAGEIADRSVALVRAALFGPGEQPLVQTWLKQVECYWEFASAEPVNAVNGIANAFRAAANATERHWAITDELGCPVFSVPLGMTPDTSKHRIAIYPRSERVRVEVRFLGGVSRMARGAGIGTTAARLTAVARASAIHVDRTLRSTWAYRGCSSILIGTAGTFDLLDALRSAFPGDRTRQRTVVQSLLRQRYLRAGDQPLCDITLNEAGRMQRQGLLVRAPMRSRDKNGRILSLSPRFDALPPDTRF